jgi:thioredoxin-related protein
MIAALLAPLFFLLGIFGTEVAPPKAQVNWITFDQLEEKLIEEPRIVMIDVYANWCGYCKKMDAQTFTDAKVADKLNTKFYTLKLNSESKDKVTFKGIETSEAELAAALKVTGLPTMIFLDPQLESVTPVPGYRDAKQFMEVLDVILQYL